MNAQFLDYLADPNDGGALQLHIFEGDAAQIREGILTSAQSGRWYPIRAGIPSVFADALRVGAMARDEAAFAARHADAMKKVGCEVSQSDESAALQGQFTRIDSERRARDEQAEDYDRMLSMRVYRRIETPVYRRAMESFEGSEYSRNGVARADVKTLPLLEAGCGTGRFTRLFAGHCSELVAADLSRDSILRNRVQHAGKTAAPVHYLHADLTHMPLKDAIFGAIAHIGVYEHIPSSELRRQFLENARRVLRPDGMLLLSAYRYGGLTKIFEKEGEHDGGIPFFRFTEDELRGEIEPYFHIESFRENLGIYMSMAIAVQHAHV